jgi:hypothetical protein
MRRALACAAAALLASCASGAAREEQHLEALSSKAKFAEIGVDEHQDAVTALARRSAQLALDELDALAPDHDTVFSPWALVRRERIIADANGADEDVAIAAMIGQLEKWQGDPRSVPNTGADGTPVLRSRTALIADRSLAVAPEFLDLLAENFDMGLYLARPGDPKLAEAVNGWAMGTADTRFSSPMPGLGARRGVYFADMTELLAGWRFPFRPEWTAPALFTTANSTSAQPQTMRGVLLARTAAGAGWRAAELSLADGVEMRVVVPADPSASLADMLPAARSALASARPGPLGFAMPRWSALADLAGAPGATAQAALPRLAPEARASGWSSQADVAFGEQGVSMAASPSVSATTAPSDPAPAISFALDRAFCFEIFDSGTGLVLLAGRVAHPGS